LSDPLKNDSSVAAFQSNVREVEMLKIKARLGTLDGTAALINTLIHRGVWSAWPLSELFQQFWSSPVKPLKTIPREA